MLSQFILRKNINNLSDLCSLTKQKNIKISKYHASNRSDSAIKKNNKYNSGRLCTENSYIDKRNLIVNHDSEENSKEKNQGKNYNKIILKTENNNRKIIYDIPQKDKIIDLVSEYKKLDIPNEIFVRKNKNCDQNDNSYFYEDNNRPCSENGKNEIDENLLSSTKLPCHNKKYLYNKRKLLSDHLYLKDYICTTNNDNNFHHDNSNGSGLFNLNLTQMPYNKKVIHKPKENYKHINLNNGIVIEQNIRHNKNEDNNILLDNIQTRTKSPSNLASSMANEFIKYYEERNGIKKNGLNSSTNIKINNKNNIDNLIQKNNESFFGLKRNSINKLINNNEIENIDNSNFHINDLYYNLDKKREKYNNLYKRYSNKVIVESNNTCFSPIKNFKKTKVSYKSPSNNENILNRRMIFSAYKKSKIKSAYSDTNGYSDDASSDGVYKKNKEQYKQLKNTSDTSYKNIYVNIKSGFTNKNDLRNKLHLNSENNIEKEIYNSDGAFNTINSEDNLDSIEEIHFYHVIIEKKLKNLAVKAELKYDSLYSNAGLN